MKGKRFAVGLVVLFLAVVCCGEASATTWFADTFNSYTNGNLQGQGGWTGGGSTVRVQSSFAESGSSVKMNYLAWGAGEASHTLTYYGGEYYVDFDAAMDTLAAEKGENLGYVKVYNSAGNEITRIYLADRQLKVLTTGPTLLLDDTEMRRWYHIRIGVYPSTGKMDVWIDGVKKISGDSTYASTVGGSSVVARIGIAEWPNLFGKFTKSELYVDNIQIETPGGVATKIISPLTGWETFNVMYPFAMYDDAAGEYRMWYAGSGFGQFSDSNWDQWNMGIAMSPDGATWAKRPYEYEPVLYAYKFYEGDAINRSTVTNIFDSIFAFGGCVIKDGATYKMWYTGWNGDSEHIGGGITRKLNYRIGYATSPDGLNWTKYSGSAGGGSILGLGSPGTYDAKGAGQPYVLKEGSNFRMWYEGFDGSVWRIMYATSSDGINWTRQGVALHPGATGALDALGVRDPVVVTRSGQYELWYTGQSAASPYSHAMRATSLDGLGWANVSGEVALHPDDVLDGNETMHVDSVIVAPDNSCRVFFGKENITASTLTYGTIMSKKTYIYTEVVNP